MKRRDFVIKSSLAAAAVSSASPGFAYINKYVGSSAPIRIGVIGTGDRGGGLISVMKNIERFIKIRDQEGFKLPMVGVNFVKMKINGRKISISEFIPVRLNSELQLVLPKDEEKEIFLKKFDFKELISSKLIIPVVIKILFCFDKLIRNSVKFW